VSARDRNPTEAEVDTWAAAASDGLRAAVSRDEAVKAEADAAVRVVLSRFYGGDYIAPRWVVDAVYPVIERAVRAQVDTERAAEAVPCTCGYGGFHEPENPRCERNIAAARIVEGKA
jgi:hypothetical protein